MFFKKKDFTHFIYLSLFLFFLFCCFFYMKYYSIESFQNSSSSLLPIYFINLKESKIRYDKMMNQCKDKHCIRIHAIHGKKDKLHTEMVKNNQPFAAIRKIWNNYFNSSTITLNWMTQPSGALRNSIDVKEFLKGLDFSTQQL